MSWIKQKIQNIKKGVKGVKDSAKNKAIKMMLEKQLKDLPPLQKEAVMKMIDENPDFFEQIAKEMQAELKKGRSQLSAGMLVMRKYQAKIQQMLLKTMGGEPKMKDRNLR